MNNAGDHYQQLFVTGVPWRTADETTERLEEHASHLVPGKKKAKLAEGDVDYSRIPASTRDVLRVFEAATGCMNAVESSIVRDEDRCVFNERIRAAKLTTLSDQWSTMLP